MTQEHIKIFLGTSILVNRLNFLLGKAGIVSIINDEVEAGRLSGFGTSTNSVEIFVLKTDVEEASLIVDNF